MQSRALPVVLAADSTDRRPSSGELKDLGPTGRAQASGLQEEQTVVTVSMSVPCERVAPPAPRQGVFRAAVEQPACLSLPQRLPGTRWEKTLQIFQNCFQTAES